MILYTGDKIHIYTEKNLVLMHIIRGKESKTDPFTENESLTILGGEEHFQTNLYMEIK